MIRVELGARSYDISIERGILSSVGKRMSLLGLKGKAAIVTNPRVGKLYGEAVSASLRSAGFEAIAITVPDGEEYKTIEVASTIYDGLIKHRMERSSAIVALGGGVIGDMAGFVAATYLRGVPFVQVPTTLLSQVDSSVGGKTGVNHPSGKNLIGAFYQPKAVFIDPDVLRTLDERELRAGLAEVIKYGVIWDEGFFSFLEENSEGLLSLNDVIIKAIERSCSIKAEVVGADETESNLRAILNFGHTFGHAIESLSGYGNFRHGEAVAIGMVLASRFSARAGLCKDADAERIKALIGMMKLPTGPPAIKTGDWIAAMRLDKKVEGARLRFVLVNSIGRVILKEVNEAELRDFFSQYKAGAV